MFETSVAVAGTVLTEPRDREVGGNRVISFVVASNSRRYDRSGEQWVDGDRLVATIYCRRRVADGVSGAIGKGSPVVVSGRLRTRDYEQHGRWRTAVEVEATAVGVDLARQDRTAAARAGFAELVREAAATGPGGARAEPAARSG